LAWFLEKCFPFILDEKHFSEVVKNLEMSNLFSITLSNIENNSLSRNSLSERKLLSNKQTGNKAYDIDFIFLFLEHALYFTSRKAPHQILCSCMKITNQIKTRLHV